MILSNPVSAEVLAFAVLAAEPLPDGVKVVGGRVDQLRLVGEDAGLEIAVAFTLHADTGTGKIGGANISHRAVENHYLEMHPRTELALQLRPQTRIFVEVPAEILPRLLRMQQPNLYAAF